MEDSSTAILSNDGNMTIFKFGDQRIKFRSPDCLIRYIAINSWDNGYIEVMTEYTETGIIEEYIDLIPVLQNLHINPTLFLTPIKRVIIS